MLDADLAKLYGVETRVLVQAVKRNIDRFPEDFMFQLSKENLTLLRSQSVISKTGRGGRRYLPYAFTEHGALMLASVLNSPIAIEVSIQILRVFIRLREALASDKNLRRRLDALEKKYDTHDAHIKEIFSAIRALMEPLPGVAKRRIGFRPLPGEDQQ